MEGEPWLVAFVRESNKIEGITRTPGEAQEEAEIVAHENFLRLDEVSVAALELFVEAIDGGPLRTESGMNVRVGSHRPLPGSIHIRTLLLELCELVNTKALSPFEAHHRYEALHPFMDGNGRSGRVLWLWMMRHALGRVQLLGFLHTWYYQSLEARTS